MAILTEQETRRIIDKVLGFSKADEASVTISGARTGNIRYARNTITTSGESNTLDLSVTTVFGKRSGTASINEFDNASLEETVRRAEGNANLSPENPEYTPMPGPQQYLKTNTFSQNTEKIIPAFRANAAFNSIDACIKKNITAAGYLEDRIGFNAIGNKKGLFGYYKESLVDFTITARTADERGSGFASQNFIDASRIDIRIATNMAIEKSLASVNAIEMPPGKYTVILEPNALYSGSDASLIRSLINALDARTADEGRSFMSKKGGGTKLDEKLFNEQVTIYSDLNDPDIPGVPFTNDGRPHEKVMWVENGIIKNLFYSPYWAMKKNVKAIAPPTGIIIKGGNQTLDEMIKGTEKGILVTRTWYIRPVNPQTLLLTGLTRDGTFYIENGKIKHAVKNFRFNESPLNMLSNLEAIGKPVRIAGAMIPPLKVRDFNFTSLSEAV